MLSDDERAELLNIARDALRGHLDGESASLPEPISHRLLENAGAFVSIHVHGRLRGCIGTFEADTRLADVVQKMAIAAGSSDPRFPPMTIAELEEAELEISVLSSRQKARPEEVVVGRHGLYLKQGSRRGVLLPQVATEHGWNREEFLDSTCRKAGIPAGSWRQDDVSVEIFTAEIFCEPAPA